ncbi:hypothetical protein BKA18_000036 [Streptomyces auratus]
MRDLPLPRLLDRGSVRSGGRVSAVESSAAVHYEHPRGDVDRRQRDIDHRGDPGADRGPHALN